MKLVPLSEESSRFNELSLYFVFMAPLTGKSPQIPISNMKQELKISQILIISNFNHNNNWKMP